MRTQACRESREVRRNGPANAREGQSVASLAASPYARDPRLRARQRMQSLGQHLVHALATTRRRSAPSESRTPSTFSIGARARLRPACRPTSACLLETALLCTIDVRKGGERGWRDRGRGARTSTSEMGPERSEQRRQTAELSPGSSVLVARDAVEHTAVAVDTGDVLPQRSVTARPAHEPPFRPLLFVCIMCV